MYHLWYNFSSSSAQLWHYPLTLILRTQGKLLSVSWSVKLFLSCALIQNRYIGLPVSSAKGTATPNPSQQPINLPSPNTEDVGEEGDKVLCSQVGVTPIEMERKLVIFFYFSNSQELSTFGTSNCAFCTDKRAPGFFTHPFTIFLYNCQLSSATAVPSFHCMHSVFFFFFFFPSGSSASRDK
jgi:hypothetical protein